MKLSYYLLALTLLFFTSQAVGAEVTKAHEKALFEYSEESYSPPDNLVTMAENQILQGNDTTAGHNDHFHIHTEHIIITFLCVVILNILI